MRISIEIDPEEAAETLRYVAALIEDGMTSGYYPSWEIVQ